MAPDVSNSRDRNLQFINSDTEMSASPGLVVSSFERYIPTTVATVVLLMIDSIPSVRRCLSRASSHCIEGEHIALVIGQFWRSVSFNSPFTALELRALETWSVRSAKESVAQ